MRGVFNFETSQGIPHLHGIFEKCPEEDKETSPVDRRGERIPTEQRSDANTWRPWYNGCDPESAREEPAKGRVVGEVRKMAGEG